MSLCDLCSDFLSGQLTGRELRDEVIDLQNAYALREVPALMAAVDSGNQDLLRELATAIRDFHAASPGTPGEAERRERMLQLIARALS